MKKTEFEKTLTPLQMVFWRAYKGFLKGMGNDYNKYTVEEKKQAEQAFLNECLKRRIH